MKQSSYLFDEKEICSFIKKHQIHIQSGSNQKFYSKIQINKSISYPEKIESSFGNKWENMELYEPFLPSVPNNGLYSRELCDDTDIQSTLSSPTASISVSTTQPVRSYNSSRYSSSVVVKPHQRKIVYCGNGEIDTENAISLRQQFEIDLRRKLNERSNLVFTRFRRSRSVSPTISRYLDLNIDQVTSSQNPLIDNRKKTEQPIITEHRRTRSLSPKKAAYAAAHGRNTKPHSEMERREQPRSPRLQWNDYFTKNKTRKSAAETEKVLEIKKKLIVDYSAPPPSMATANRTPPFLTDKRSAATSQTATSVGQQARFLSTKYDKKNIAKTFSPAAVAAVSSSTRRLHKSPVSVVPTSGSEKKIGTKETAMNASIPSGSSVPLSSSSPAVVRRSHVHSSTGERSIPLSNDKILSHEIDRLLRRKKLAAAAATYRSPSTCPTVLSTAVNTNTANTTTITTTSSTDDEHLIIEPATITTTTASTHAITLESLSEPSPSNSDDQQQPLFDISASFSAEVFESLEDSSPAATTSPASTTIMPKRYSIPDDFFLRESPPKAVRSHPLFKETLVSTVLTLKEQVA